MYIYNVMHSISVLHSVLNKYIQYMYVYVYNGNEHNIYIMVYSKFIASCISYYYCILQKMVRSVQETGAGASSEPSWDTCFAPIRQSPWENLVKPYQPQI